MDEELTPHQRTKLNAIVEEDGKNMAATEQLENSETYIMRDSAFKIMSCTVDLLHLIFHFVTDAGCADVGFEEDCGLVEHQPMTLEILERKTNLIIEDSVLIDLRMLGKSNRNVSGRQLLTSPMGNVSLNKLSNKNRWCEIQELRSSGLLSGFKDTAMLVQR